MKKYQTVLANLLVFSILLTSCSTVSTVNITDLSSETIKINNEENNLNRNNILMNQPSLKDAFSSIAQITSLSKNSTEKISVEAKEYLDIVVDLMKNNFIRKKEIDWDMLEREVFKTAANAQTKSDTYIAIVRAMQILNEKHTFFMTPDGKVLNAYSDLSKTNKIKFSGNLKKEQTSENIGYLKINGFSGNLEEATNYARSLEEDIIKQDSKDLSGWIIDLRGNTGGSMWPMLAGLNPILGNDNTGFFIDSDGQTSSWRPIQDTVIIKYKLKNYQLKNKNLKIAVLQDKMVASSGESTAISFIGKKNTKSFGQETMGYSTCNASNLLSDGATLVLTIGFMADRNKKVYGGKISPDVLLENEDLTMPTAIKWILNP